MAAFLDVCRYVPTAGGTTDWTFSATVIGYQSPTAAGVVNGRAYKYRAESADLTQWEIGEGTYNTGTGVLTRTTVLYNSAGTTAKISFTAAPNVSIIAIKEDLISIEEANSFTATQRAQARTNISAVLKGHLFGLTLSAAGASATFGVASGEAADSTGVDLLSLGSAFTKTTSAWAVGGSGNGALDTGTIAASTWYHVFLIKRPDTGVVDVLFSLSATAPTLPTNYTLFRRIGSMRTDGSSQWMKFLQTGDQFLWDVPLASVSAFAATTTQSLQTVSVPIGVSVIALLHFLGTNTAGSGVIYLVNSGLGSAQAAGTPLGNFTAENPTISVFGTCDVQILTNTSGQVGVSASTSTNNQVYLITVGWLDTRGRIG